MAFVLDKPSRRDDQNRSHSGSEVDRKPSSHNEQVSENSVSLTAQFLYTDDMARSKGFMKLGQKEIYFVDVISLSFYGVFKSLS